MWTFLNQEFVENGQAVLHVSDLSVQRGYGVFDFFRHRDGILDGKLKVLGRNVIRDVGRLTDA